MGLVQGDHHFSDPPSCKCNDCSFQCHSKVQHSAHFSWDRERMKDYCRMCGGHEERTRQEKQEGQRHWVRKKRGKLKCQLNKCKMLEWQIFNPPPGFTCLMLWDIKKWEHLKCSPFLAPVQRTAGKAGQREQYDLQPVYSEQHQRHAQQWEAFLQA